MNAKLKIKNAKIKNISTRRFLIKQGFEGFHKLPRIFSAYKAKKNKALAEFVKLKTSLLL